MHDKKVKQIEEILAKIDPVKLIKIGAPLDEYAYEAQDIYEQINRWSSIEKIHQVVYDVFVAAFSGGNTYMSDSEGHLKQVGYVEPSQEKARPIIGLYEDYKFIATQIKKVLDE